MLNKKALAASVSVAPKVYVEDVFSTYLYTGNGSTQTINNGIRIGDYPTNGTVFHLTGDNSTDSSPFPISVTVNSGTSVSTSVKKYGTGSLSFNGTSNGIKLSTDVVLSSDFTIECWAYASNITADRAILGRSGVTNTQLLRLNADGETGNILAYSDAYIFGSPNNNALSGISSNSWFHIAMTRQNGVCRLFVNGDLKETSYFTNSITIDQVGLGTGTDNKWSGNIDDFRIIDGKAIYTANFTTPSAALPLDTVSSGDGGMVFTKQRSGTRNGNIVDTARGGDYFMYTNTTDEHFSYTSLGFSPYTFKSDGFVVSNAPTSSENATTFASWTFRKAKKFFDIVTYTGNGSNRTISHNLGSVPGMIIVKRTSSSEEWFVYHRSQGATKYATLNSTGDFGSNSTIWNNTEPTSSVFSIGTNNAVNLSGATYVVYLFAHDAGGFGDAGTDNIISCGTFNGADAPVSVTLGYEPQFLLVKRTDSAGDWRIFDNMRGMTADGKTAMLYANATNAEIATNIEVYTPTATGFIAGSNIVTGTYVYMAIRRPMKTPTGGYQVFAPTRYTGTNADNRLVDTGLLTDMVMLKERNDTVAGMVVGDRLRGQPYLLTGSTAVEVNDADSLDQQIVSTTEYGNAFSSHTGVYVGNDTAAKVNIDTTSNNHIAWAFKRSPQFFDIVCYTGTGSNTTVTHNLNSVPELMIIKKRSGIEPWGVYSASVGNTAYLRLNTADSSATLSTVWNNTSPTATVFSLGSNALVNQNGSTYVAYLFASVNGISKIGSYTGNGSSQTINCGFSYGARFVLIKRTDSTGDWYVFDTARGIGPSNDPFIFLNSASAETTGLDAVDPNSSGFVVNNDATLFPINVNNATYIYLAIA